MGENTQGYKKGSFAKAKTVKNSGGLREDLNDELLQISETEFLKIKKLLDNSTISERSDDDQYVVPSFFNLEANVQILKNPFHAKNESIFVIMGDNKTELKVLKNLYKDIIESMQHKGVVEKLSPEAVEVRSSLILTASKKNQKFELLMAQLGKTNTQKRTAEAKEKIDESINTLQGYKMAWSRSFENKLDALMFNDIYKGNNEGMPFMSPVMMDVFKTYELENSQNLHTNIVVINNKQADDTAKFLATRFNKSKELDNKHDDIFKEFVYYHEIAHEDSVDIEGNVHQSKSLEQVIEGRPMKSASGQNNEIHADLVSIIQLSTNPKYDKVDILDLLKSIQAKRALGAIIQSDWHHYSSDSLAILEKSMGEHFEKYANIDRTKIYKIAGLINKISISNQKSNSHLIDEYGEIIQSPPTKWFDLSKESKKIYTKGTIFK